MPARRLVADQIRGRNCNDALALLASSPCSALPPSTRKWWSAVANARRIESVNVNRLYISTRKADEGPMLQNRLRWRPGPQGRAMPFAKKTSHSS
ncbi:MAG: uL22 family ribosomal protein [Planctomycetota bacterium]